MQNRQGLFDEVIYAVWAIEKAGDAWDHQLRNSSDVRGEHRPFQCHGFHQRNGDPLASAGENHQIRLPVLLYQLFPCNMPKQGDFIDQFERANHAFKVVPLRAVSSDAAAERKSATLEFAAGSQQESMIFHSVQTSHREQHWRACGQGHRGGIGFVRDRNAQTLHQYILASNLWVMLEHMPSIKLGDGQAKSAMGELHIEELGVDQKVRAVQREAVGNP